MVDKVWNELLLSRRVRQRCSFSGLLLYEQRSAGDAVLRKSPDELCYHAYKDQAAAGKQGRG